VAHLPAEPCPQQLGDALRWGVRLLTARGIESPRLDVEVLLAHLLQVERPQLLIRRDECLSTAQIEAFTELMQRRAQHEPVAYLIGQRPFYDVTLQVTPDVLIPRHATEHLVDEALAWAAGRDGPLRLVDVGTGSGALALTLARRLPEAQVWAVDISLSALRVARENLRRYGLEQRVCLVQGDLLAPLGAALDLIVSNLPYIDADRMPELEPNVGRYEPHLALDGGAGGIEIIARLVPQLATHLARPGLALLEMDPQQVAPVQALARRTLPDARMRVIRDYGGHDRVLVIEREGV
jgi:release factor glutamine methyltransferase